MAKPSISYEQLIAYAAGTLEGIDPAAVEAYLRRSPADAEAVRCYRQSQQLLSSDEGHWDEPSSAAIARAQAIFRHRVQAATDKPLGWLEAVDRFIARLVFDSRLDPVGVRYAPTADRINLTYEASDCQVDLQAERLIANELDADDRPDRWRVLGQVTCEGSSASAPIELAMRRPGTSQPVALAVADQRGGFDLEVPSGEYEMLIRLPTGVALLQDVRIA